MRPRPEPEAEKAIDFNAILVNLGVVQPRDEFQELLNDLLIEQNEQQ